MLLIDRRGSLHAVIPERAEVPFCPVRLDPGLHDAEALLDRFRHDRLLEITLACALAIAGDRAPPFGASALLAAAARALADGRLPVGREVVPGIALRFDPAHPKVQHGTEAIIFPSLPIAEDFVVALLAEPKHAAHATAALADPAGKRFEGLTKASVRQTGGLGRGQGGPATALSPTASGLAQRLYLRQLLLVPTDISHLSWLLAWQAPSVTLRVERGPAPAPTPPPAPPSSAPLPQPRSPMPVAPETLSPQALALKEAAKHGIPFCEECAKRAADLADAA
jgi:hypothetical protein